MPIKRFEIIRREPFADGMTFGEVGAYERIEALAHYRVDPNDPTNQVLTDIDHVERESDGMIAMTGEVSMIRPVNPDAGNRCAMVELPNRGKRTAPRQYNLAPMQIEYSDAIDVGDGFLMRHGWSVVWCGWQWDVPEETPGVKLRAPLVNTAAHPHPGGREQMHFRVQPAHNRSIIPLTDQHVGALGKHARIRAAAADDSRDRLYVRDGMYGEASLLDRSAWRFCAAPDGSGPLEYITLDDGFETGRIYDVVYQPAECRWASSGLAALRELGLFLRTTESPLYGSVDHLITQGLSQCGRALRHFLYCGMNSDSDGGLVYDGVLAHIAGARRGEFNHRYGQPSVQPTPSFGHLPPFADHAVEGVSDGLLDRCYASQSMPKVFFTDTAAEYWRGDASAGHIDVVSKTDLPEDPNVRRYLYASAQHSPGVLPFTDRNDFGTHGQNNFNVVDYRPLSRASLEVLRQWVVEGIEPPVSAYPRLDDGTAVPRETVLSTLEQVPGYSIPPAASLPGLRALDLGSAASRGVGEFPARFSAERVPSWVSAVNADGNEVAGISMPDVTYPVASHSGFSPRSEKNGAAGELLEYVGSSVPLPRTEFERQSRGDPRPSITGRYESKERYLEAIELAAESLVGRRYLLAEDIALCIELARRRYDAVMEPGQ